MDRAALEAKLREGLALQRRGALPAAADCYEAVLRVQPDLVTALNYLGLLRFQQGKLDDAERRLRRALALQADNASGWSNLGMVLARTRRSEEAVEAFSKALELRPDHPDALHNKAQTLRQMGRFEQARPLAEKLVALRPDAAPPRYLLATILHRANNIDGALPIYREALRLAPDDKRIRLGLGDALESAGEFDAARAQYEAILESEADSPLALARLLQLRNGEPSPQRLERARALAADPATLEDGRVRLNIALAYYHDRQQQYKRAFEHLQSGYGVLAGRQPFDSAGYTRAVDRLISTLPAELFNTARTSGLDTRRPIFIVGMPRSGTTLTEQILASHSQVAAGGELSALLNVSYRIGELSTSGEPYPGGLASVAPAGLETLARQYLNNLDKVAPGASHVTDKLPFNFMHLGVIALLFPNARIVHCRRHPLDNCLSCYFTSFADQIRFANQLDTLGRYYLDYERLMRHWHAVLPLEILDLQYERLVDDTGNQVRQLVDFCGLEWEDSCLDFHRTRRAVRTPSRWQVRQPIYRGSVGRWRNYREQLAPLASLLAPLLGDGEEGREGPQGA